MKEHIELFVLDIVLRVYKITVQRVHLCVDICISIHSTHFDT